MSQYVPLVGVEAAEKAAHRLEAAALEATRAADRIETAIHQLRILTEDGYGNNVSTLIELLRREPGKDGAK